MEKPVRDDTVRIAMPAARGVALRVSHAIERLRIAIEVLVESKWSESARSRAKLSADLAVKACSGAGNFRAAKVARAILALSQLSLADVLPIREALRVQFLELLGMLEELTESDVA